MYARLASAWSARLWRLLFHWNADLWRFPIAVCHREVPTVLRQTEKRRMGHEKVQSSPGDDRDRGYERLG